MVSPVGKKESLCGEGVDVSFPSIVRCFLEGPLWSRLRDGLNPGDHIEMENGARAYSN